MLCYWVYHLPLTPTAINGVPSDTSRQLDQWVRGAVLITCKKQRITRCTTINAGMVNLYIYMYMYMHVQV